MWTITISHGYSRRAFCTLLFAPVFIGAACAPRPAQVASPERGYGYIVVGPGAAESYGLVSGDTLPEAESRTVPTAVTGAAGLQALQYEFAPACTRYFQHSRGYLVLLVWKCKPGDRFDDGEGMAAYTLTGDEIGKATSRLSNEYTELHPEQRAAQ